MLTEVMMKTPSFFHGMFLILSCVYRAQAVCSSNLLVDDYSNFNMSKNSLGRYTSDDGTTRNLNADPGNMKITFNAIQGSYFYTNFDCEAAITSGYTAFTFPIKSTCGASFQVELQTSIGCNVISSTAYNYNVPTKMIGDFITVTVPLNSFMLANPDAIRAFVFGGFTLGSWEIGATQLVCGDSQSNSINVSTTPSSLSTCVVPTTSSMSTMATVASYTLISNSTSTAASSSTSSLSFSSSSIPTTSTWQASPSTKTTDSSAAANSCTNLLVDDFSSSSRLLVQHINALLQPSCDNSTMKEVTVANNHVTLIPKDSKSYFYTSFGCLKATNIYAGISFTIFAKVHTDITIELRTSKTCTASNLIDIDITSTSLHWTFDGTEQTRTISFTEFVGLDTGHLISLYISGTRNPFTLGSINFFCKDSRSYGS